MDGWRELMTRVRRLKNGDIAEKSIHKAIMQWVSVHPKLKEYKPFMLHIPNEGKRTLRHGRLMKSLGMRKGAVDLFIAVPRHGFGGAWIELKSANGVLRPEQKQFLDDMKANNFHTDVCWSIEEGIKTISWYLG